jgi:hypothetical protein
MTTSFRIGQRDNLSSGSPRGQRQPGFERILTSRLSCRRSSPNRHIFACRPLPAGVPQQRSPLSLRTFVLDMALSNGCWQLMDHKVSRHTPFAVRLTDVYNDFSSCLEQGAVDARYRGAFFRLLMKTLAAPAAVEKFSGARLQARGAVGLDGQGSAPTCGSGRADQKPRTSVMSNRGRLLIASGNSNGFNKNHVSGRDST